MPTESWSVTEPQTIDIESVSSLRAGIIAGRLDVIAHDGEGARVEVAEVSGEPLVVTLTEGRLEVRHREDGAQGWFKSMLGTISGATQNTAVVSIALPARVPVEVGTVTGDGLVSGTGPVTKLNTVSGSVLADGTHGELHINTVSGEVIARGHEGLLTAKTVSGEVTASGELDHVRANSVSGDLSFDSAGTMQDIGANTVSGALTVRIPHGVGLDLGVRTSSGRVVVDDERFTILGGKIAANLGPEGQRIRLRANTVSGDVAVVHAAAPADPAPEAPAAAQEPGRGTED